MFHQSVIRVRAGTKTDRGGNVVKDWASASKALIGSLSVQPAVQSEESDPTRTAVVTGWRVLSAPGTAPDIRADDRIEHAGMVCEVEGEVAAWPDPLTGGVHHVEFVIKRATG
ncbi:hypothetical protein [Streptomyces sp. SPB074]|uniref:hypothetical protein n=1 Tax=Streptomyces sp. (strain SPB074) TaxID=465543 RepID=UPI00017F0E11|nr:hypothetical protein [Streptomyces sp. SPB074]